MPRKKTSTSQPGKSPKSATAVPVTPSDQTEVDTAAQTITVRRAATAEPVEPPVAESAVVPHPEASEDDIDDVETDKAVDDIMAKESDLVLAVDDMLAGKEPQNTQATSWTDKLLALLRNKWTWIGLLAILIILFGIPTTRYKLLGLVLKEKVSVTVIDSQTKTPVSNAVISLAGVTTKTDANGTAQLKAEVGEHSLVITKQYYRATDTRYFIGLRSNNPPVTITLIATGRQVPITVDNTISGKPLADAIIHILNTTVKTNAKGQASIALPTSAVSDNATISLAGYNTKQVSVQVTAQMVPGNTFNLTPAGSVYFLSNQSGTINVVKTNLDGSGRQTVLAGSGHETASTTRLLASSDWHYLVLEANRSGNGPALYLINTTNNQVSEFDSSNATFKLIGWYGHDFLYSITSSTENQWQAGYQVVKEYNADQSELNQLDQNLALGSAASYAYQNFSNFYIAGGALVYDSQWMDQGAYDLSNENDTIRVFQFNSQVLKDYEAFPASTTGVITANRYQPQAVYFEVPSISSVPSYYQYSDQNVQAASINQSIFNQTNPAYLLSPSGNYSVWSELSNGQNLFLKGNSSAANQQQIAALSGYSPYGWYSDNYVLASRGNNQLYVLPASGLSGTRQPLSISAYYEPAASSGYEYGGL